MAPCTGAPPNVPVRPPSTEVFMPASHLEQLSIDTMRTLAIDAVQQANSGHPGMPMGCAPIGYLLFTEAMRHDPARPDWWARDRFVLSAGHGSMLLYASLHLTGYDRPTLADLKQFRQWGSPTAGHPENFHLAGVETTTGPLGQGFTNGVGMALAARKLAAEFNRPGHELFDHTIYAIVSDGDLMEGVASEAASLAGHLRLGNLVYLYDDNSITIDGGTDLAFTEDVLARFRAYGWHTDRVEDGNDLDALRAAIGAAQAADRPSLISVRTIIGFGSPNKAGKSSSHGSPLGPDEVEATKQAYGWVHGAPFEIPADARANMDQRSRGAALTADWDERFAAYRDAHPDLAAELERRMAGRLPDGWQDALPELTDKKATRVHSGAVINALSGVLPELIGGSADLAGSNNTTIEGAGFVSADDVTAPNIHFGVREHAMAAMCNGIALHGGYLPFGATFLVFTDYCRPAIRLSALMGTKVVYVMTHDSIGLGEDGPTHQPVEHLASLRAIPGLQVLRPADGDETVGAWAAALAHDGPSVLALTRQGVPPLGDKPGGAVAAVDRGAYVLSDPDGDIDVILIGTGSEVQLALAAAEWLAADGIGARVVSMPSWERFAALPQADRDAVLPPRVRARVAVEAGAAFGWERWVGDHGRVVGLDRFGASAPAEVLFEELGITAATVAAAARASLAGLRG
jgi:transketolase